MIKTFTYDDVVRYVFSETTQEESEQIALALSSNDDLMSFYMDTLEIRDQMDRITRSPSEGFVQRIMAYSALVPNLTPTVSTDQSEKLGGIKKWVRFVEKKFWTRNYSLYCYPLDWWKSLIWRRKSHYQTVTIYFFLKKTFLLRGQRDINWNPKVFSIQLSFATFLFEVKPATFISSVGNGGTMTWVRTFIMSGLK